MVEATAARYLNLSIPGALNHILDTPPTFGRCRFLLIKWTKTESNSYAHFITTNNNERQITMRGKHGAHAGSTKSLITIRQHNNAQKLMGILH